jgi:intracellular multiplication protein IcmV
MAVRDVLKVSRKTFVNPSAWLGVDGIKSTFSAVVALVIGVFRRPEVGEPETFEEAMQRREVTEDDIKSMITNYLTYAYLFVCCGVATVVFAFYLLFFHFTLSGWLLAMASSALFFAQAFKFHFWAFQLQQRKLGCTFAEWKQSLFKNKDAAS